jgi:RNA-binding protein YhbY
MQELNTAESIAKEAAQQTESALVEVRGHVFILFRKRRSAETTPEKTSP